jgi:hypothetical protein
MIGILSRSPLISGVHMVFRTLKGYPVTNSGILGQIHTQNIIGARYKDSSIMSGAAEHLE